MAKKKTTSAPSGFAVARSGGTVVFTWSQGEKYEKQQWEFFINGYNSGVSDINKKATSASISVPIDVGTLSSFAVRVRGKADKKEWSAWGGGETYNMSVPAIPTVTAEYGGTSASNQTTFSWTAPEDSVTVPFTDIEIQAGLVQNANYDSPANTVWEPSEYYPTANSKLIPENFDRTGDDYSWTRFFRARSRGAAGTSPWAYAKHVYTMSKRSENVSATIERAANGNGYVLNGKWNTPSDYARPIDSIVAGYAIVVPDTTTNTVTHGAYTYVQTIMTCPENATWVNKTLVDVTDTNANKESASFTITQGLEKDQVIFFKVDTVHDDVPTPGVPVPVIFKGSTSYGFLDPATGIDILPNPSTHRVQVTATNQSAITSAFLAVHYKTKSNASNSKIIGVLPKNTSSDVFVAPNDDWTTDPPSFGLQALVGNYMYSEFSSGKRVYGTYQTLLTQKDISWKEGEVALPPNVTAVPHDLDGIDVTWTWTWSEANRAEISWAENDYAWESTEQPQTYVVTNLHANSWRIAGISPGQWYVRVRLINETDEGTVYGMYSETIPVKIASSPATPVLSIPSAVVTKDGTLSCYWSYATEDGSMQEHAEIVEVTKDGSGNYVYDIAHEFIENTAQHIDIDVAKSLIRDRGWAVGETHMLAVRVQSALGEKGNWSAPVAVKIAEPPTATLLLTNQSGLPPVTSLEWATITIEGVATSGYVLRDMPLIVTCTGAGNGGTTTIIVERKSSFPLIRPDERDSLYGFAGETLAIESHTGEGSFAITNDMLLGPKALDHGAEYTITAIVKDSNGLTDKATVDFAVNWRHRAFIPDGTIQIDSENNIAIIRPIAASGYVSSDVCDIYRLSADRPELVVRGAAFGTDYVDPYPTLGRFGGHRLVTRTANGDYRTVITEEGVSTQVIAWKDFDEEDGDRLDTFGIIIDFNGDSVTLPYNVSVSNSWKKDFQKTSYLGGSVQGDWNPTTERTATLNAVSVVFDTPEDISAMRRLADYSGLCHVRTPEGSSYSANVDVSENYEEKMINKLAKFSITITAVDSNSENGDGMTLAEWTQAQEE